MQVEALGPGIDDAEAIEQIEVQVRYSGYVDRQREEIERAEHYAGGREYHAYASGLDDGADLWTKWSERFINWRQLEIMGLMSKGNWA
jgi:hypothetical protein